MNQMTAKVLVVAVLLASPLTSYAQYRLCNGAYTNKPCGATEISSQATPTPAVTSSPVATQSPSKTPVSPPFSERYAIIRNLKKSSQDNISEGKQGLSAEELEEIRLVCQNPNIAFAECTKRAQQLEEAMAKRNASGDSIPLQGQ